MSDKKNGGVIVGWEIHQLSTSIEMADQLGFEIQTDGVYIMSGTVKEDPTGRWEPGFHMRSSIIVAMDLDKGWIETQNTFYKLEGPRGDILPEMGDAITTVFYQ